VRWWRKAGFVSEYLRRQKQAKLYEYTFQLNIALLDYKTEQSTFDLHYRQAERARNHMIECVMPWVDAGPKSLRESLNKMRETYLENFADPASPEGEAAIAKQIGKWKERRKQYGNARRNAKRFR